LPVGLQATIDIDKRIHLAARHCLEFADFVRKVQRETRAASLQSVTFYGFRYAYLYRLIDESEFSGLERKHAAKLRKIHGQCYRKNVSLITRDLRRALRALRAEMDRTGWDYEAVIKRHVEAYCTIATLVIGGWMNFLRLPVATVSVRGACAAVRDLIAALPSSAPGNLRQTV
jgi:hypothetical protein